MGRLTEIAKAIAFRHTRLGRPTYRYQLEPLQLAEIVFAIEAVAERRDTPLTILEIGVARGMTTRFIAEHIRSAGYDVNYYCIDTFSSFTDADLAYEEQHRGKRRSEMRQFTYNDFAAWKANLAEFDFITAIQADAGTFDYGTLGPIDFCFLDVDLYRPTLDGLRRIWPNMADRSVLMVDDVNEHNRLWDGAHQAFFEFANEQRLPFRLTGNKCGVLWKGERSPEPAQLNWSKAEVSNMGTRIGEQATQARVDCLDAVAG